MKNLIAITLLTSIVSSVNAVEVRNQKDLCKYGVEVLSPRVEESNRAFGQYAKNVSTAADRLGFIYSFNKETLEAIRKDYMNPPRPKEFGEAFYAMCMDKLVVRPD